MRISRHSMFMEIAQVVAKRSTCFRENVGAIIVNHNKIISIGYNGKPSGEPPCKYHPQGKCTKAIHAEINAINPLLGQDWYDLELYVTHLPCLNCTQFIISCGMIKKVFFQILYGDGEPIYKKLDDHGITLHRVMPSGDITSYDRSEVYHDFK